MIVNSVLRSSSVIPLARKSLTSVHRIDEGTVFFPFNQREGVGVFARKKHHRQTLKPLKWGGVPNGGVKTAGQLEGGSESSDRSPIAVLINKAYPYV